MPAPAGATGMDERTGVRVCMFVKNTFEYDARVTREAATLVRAGHGVTVVALHLPGVTAREETRDGAKVVRVDRLYGRLVDLVPGFLANSTVAAGAGRPTRSEDRRTRSEGRTTRAEAREPRGDGGPRRVPPAVGRARRALERWLRAATPAAAFPLRLANTVVTNRRMVRAGLASGADVWHAHDLNTLGVAGRCAALGGGRLVYDSHELHTARSGMGPLRRTVAGALERRGIRRADAVVTATSSWADDLARRYGIPRPAVVRNLPVATRVDEPVDLRARLGIRGDERILLYQGSIQRHRGIEEAIAALPLLDRCTLVVCGYGAHRPVLEALATHHGLAHRVRFDGPVPHDALLAYTAGADVGLCLIRNSSRSYYLSLPNKLFEYVMAGVPQVTSDFPEMGAVVRRHGVGEVCDPDDPASVAAAVRRIVDDPDAAGGYRARAAAAAGELHWGVEEPRLLGVYDSIR